MYVISFMLCWLSGNDDGSRMKKDDGRTFWSRNMEKKVRGCNYQLGCNPGGGGISAKYACRVEDRVGSKQK